MRRLALVLCVGAVVAAVSVAYAVPALAQAQEEQRVADSLLQRAEKIGVEVPSDPEAIIQLGAKYDVSISPELAEVIALKVASKDGNPEAAASKDKGGKKALPKSSGANVGSLLGLGAGVALIGSALVVHRRSTRRRG